MFGKNLRRLWLFLTLVTILAEIVPVAGLLPPAFYTYKSTKIVLFFLLGYLTPITFHNVNRLNRGLLVALGSASFVEILQALIGNGHVFSFFELAGKFVLIMAGFAIALNARYDQALTLGKWRIQLWTDLIPRR